MLVVPPGADSPHRYDRFAALAGDLAPLSEDGPPYRVSTKRLQGHRPIRTLCMALAALSCQVLFMVWLFQPDHLPGVNESPALHVASLAMVVSIFGIQFFLLVNVATLIVATVIARDPVPVRPARGTRVAFLTTIVPSKEPIEGVRRTLAAARAVRHDGTLDVWLLDEGDDRFVRRVCSDLGVRHFTRKGVEEWNRPTGVHKAKTKHGNYNAWLAAHGDHYDYVVSVDPDHVPLPQFCERMLGYFRDPDVAFVVGPQVYGNFDNFVTKAAESQQYLFHSLLQRAGNYFGAPMLVGTNNAIRIAALRSIGGMQDSITEDMATSLAVHAGRNAVTGSRWRSVYTPDVLAVGEGPSSWTDYFSQQLRWSRGTDEVLLRTFWRFGRRLRPGQFLHYTLLVSYYPTMGFAWLLGALNSVLYLVLGAGGLTVEAHAWLMLYAYSALFQVMLYGWNRRHNVSPHEKEGSSGALGMLISMLSVPLYAHSLISTLLRRESSFVVTPKGDSISPDRCATFRWHGLWGGFLAACLAASVVLGNAEPAMRVWTVLALSICVLPPVIWQVQSIFRVLRGRSREPRADYSAIEADRLTGVAHETAA
jgi:cellulose synthase/poly-beta-1,6-N-acetylglucosamine synthase-like glycosyltransferase